MTDTTIDVLTKELEQLAHNYKQLEDRYQKSVLAEKNAKDLCDKLWSNMVDTKELMDNILKDLNDH